MVQNRRVLHLGAARQCPCGAGQPEMRDMRASRLPTDQRHAVAPCRRAPRPAHSRLSTVESHNTTAPSCSALLPQRPGVVSLGSALAHSGWASDPGQPGGRHFPLAHPPQARTGMRCTRPIPTWRSWYIYGTMLPKGCCQGVDRSHSIAGHVASRSRNGSISRGLTVVQMRDL